MRRAGAASGDGLGLRPHATAARRCHGPPRRRSGRSSRRAWSGSRDRRGIDPAARRSHRRHQRRPRRRHGVRRHVPRGNGSDDRGGIGMKSSAITASVPASASAPTALVAHGDTRMRSSYVQLLRAHAFLTEESNDGRVALAMAIVRRPDVILLEPGLDGIDGYQLCRLLRRDPDTRGAAIVVVAMQGEPYAVTRGRDAGADAVLVPPCSFDLMIAEMRRALDTRTARLLEQAQPRMAKATLAGDRGRHELPPPPAPDDRPMAPPDLRCPECLCQLVYQRS